MKFTLRFLSDVKFGRLNCRELPGRRTGMARMGRKGEEEEVLKHWCRGRERNCTFWYVVWVQTVGQWKVVLVPLQHCLCP